LPFTSSAAPRGPKIPESVLVVVHTAALDVLLIERTDVPGFWQSVTGSKDRLDEALRDVAAREVAEETGIIVAVHTDHAEAGRVDTIDAVGQQSRPYRVDPAHLRDWRHAISYEIYDMWRHRYAPGVTTNTEHWFSLEVPTGIPITLSAREHTAYRWLPWREAAAQCASPSNGQAILELPQRLAVA